MLANEAYRLNPMPVPAVLVTLHGAKGGLLLDEDSGKEASHSKEGKALSLSLSRHMEVGLWKYISTWHGKHVRCSEQKSVSVKNRSPGQHVQC